MVRFFVKFVVDWEIFNIKIPENYYNSRHSLRSGFLSHAEAFASSKLAIGADSGSGSRAGITPRSA
jgi:hypothetical protein